MKKKKFLLKIKIDAIGKFIERPNRFIAHVNIDNNNLVNEETIVAHVHDSGRLTELLYSGNKVSLRKAPDGSNRKTDWDVISALGDNGEEVLINSSFHRKITDLLFNDSEISPFGKVDFIKAEKKFGKSRLDYYIEKGDEKIWIETKGVSLAINKKAQFPDAPSIRATKHLEELMEIKKQGDRAAVILIVLRDAESFEPKWDTDPVFSKTFYEAMEEGVEIYPIQFLLENGEIYWTNKKIKISSKKYDCLKNL